MLITWFLSERDHFNLVGYHFESLSCVTSNYKNQSFSLNWNVIFCCLCALGWILLNILWFRVGACTIVIMYIHDPANIWLAFNQKNAVIHCSCTKSKLSRMYLKNIFLVKRGLKFSGPILQRPTNYTTQQTDRYITVYLHKLFNVTCPFIGCPFITGLQSLHFTVTCCTMICVMKLKSRLFPFLKCMWNLCSQKLHLFSTIKTNCVFRNPGGIFLFPLWEFCQWLFCRRGDWFLLLLVFLFKQQN
jgi:hypothetical protein